jgi:predicted DNA-binding transcriptional regulator AlpA
MDNHLHLPPTTQQPELPPTGFFRLPTIIGDPTATPPIPPLIPISKSSWWSGVSSGRFPKPIKLGPRTTAWRVEDIHQLIHDLAEGKA